MNYAEFLRARRAFSIYALIVAVVAAIIIVSMHFATVHHGVTNVSISMDLSDDAPSASHAQHAIPRDPAVPLGTLLGLAGYFSAAFATVLAASLNRENERAGFVFTRPVSRVRLGLSYMLVDVVAIVAAYVYAFVVFCLAPLASLGMLRTVFVDAHAGGIALLAVGASLLWYGVLQAVTAGYRGRGGAFVGFSWIAFISLVALSSLTALGPIFHAVVMVCNLLNPLAYVSGFSTGPGGRDVIARSVFALPLETRAAMAWAIAVAASAVALFAWKRLEV